MLENPGAAVSIRTHESLRWIRYLVALAVLSASVLAQTRPAPSKEEFESFLHRGFQFHEQSAYDKALPLLQSAYRLQPRDYFVNLLLGIEMLRTGQAGSAYIECAYTAMATRTLSLCYVRTGSGWSGQLGQAGQVVWTPFSAQCSSGQQGSPGQSPWQRFPRPAR